MAPPTDLQQYSPTLTWCPSPTAIGYKIYYGTSPGSYGEPIIKDNIPNHVVHQLGPGTYYFAVTAFDINGAESDFSNEVPLTVVPEIVPGPAIINVSVPSILTNEAIVVWSTSIECSGAVLWGTDPARLFSVVSNNLGTTDHLSRITGLTRRTHYVYKVESVCDGKTIRSEIRSFNTK